MPEDDFEPDDFEPDAEAPKGAPPPGVKKSATRTTKEIIDAVGQTTGRGSGSPPKVPMGYGEAMGLAAEEGAGFGLAAKAAGLGQMYADTSGGNDIPRTYADGGTAYERGRDEHRERTAQAFEDHPVVSNLTSMVAGAPAGIAAGGLKIGQAAKAALPYITKAQVAVLEGMGLGGMLGLASGVGHTDLEKSQTTDEAVDEAGRTISMHGAGGLAAGGLFSSAVEGLRGAGGYLWNQRQATSPGVQAAAEVGAEPAFWSSGAIDAPGELGAASKITQPGKSAVEVADQNMSRVIDEELMSRANPSGVEPEIAGQSPSTIEARNAALKYRDAMTDETAASMKATETAEDMTALAEDDILAPLDPMGTSARDIREQRYTQKGGQLPSAKMIADKASLGAQAADVEGRAATVDAELGKQLDEWVNYASELESGRADGAPKPREPVNFFDTLDEEQSLMSAADADTSAAGEVPRGMQGGRGRGPSNERSDAWSQYEGKSTESDAYLELAAEAEGKRVEDFTSADRARIEQQRKFNISSGADDAMGEALAIEQDRTRAREALGGQARKLRSDADEIELDPKAFEVLYAPTRMLRAVEGWAANKRIGGSKLKELIDLVQSRQKFSKIPGPLSHEQKALKSIEGALSAIQEKYHPEHFALRKSTGKMMAQKEGRAGATGVRGESWEKDVKYGSEVEQIIAAIKNNEVDPNALLDVKMSPEDRAAMVQNIKHIRDTARLEKTAKNFDGEGHDARAELGPRSAHAGKMAKGVKGFLNEKKPLKEIGFMGSTALVKALYNRLAALKKLPASRNAIGTASRLPHMPEYEKEERQ